MSAAAPHLTLEWRRRYTQRLVRWYAEHQRDLPWRRTRDPYAIWISETMLQQTQVATVIDYYHRFLARFPTVEALAAADEQEVLGLWAGLGYYRRARQLHAASQQVVSQHRGNFPGDVPSLMQLAGVGRYTAGAIASIAFDKPAPILEANTERLYARLLCLREPTRSPASLALLWQFAEWSLPRGASRSPNSSARTINQAAMELGSLVCKPVNPRCCECPLAALCPTALHGLQSAIPVPKPKKSF
ncbi:MAG: A/G-specific adenine glycosylase, partial [Aureliella sp.]